MAEVGAPISQDGMALHPDYWCICLCYLHFAPENPENGKDMTFWLSPHGRPHIPTQTGGGETQPERSSTLRPSTGVVECWHAYVSGSRCRFAYAQLMPLPLTISCSSKSRLVFPFWFYFSGIGSPG